MKILSKVFIFIFLTIVTTANAKAKEWRGIVPLHSTREDVEKLLGPATNTACKCVYDLRDESVYIIYASGPPCKDNANSAWQVSRDTVIQIIVIPKTELRLSELKFDLNKFEKKPNIEQPSDSFYVNAKDGVSVEVDKDIVIAITYFPEAKDNNLRCPNSAKFTCNTI